MKLQVHRFCIKIYPENAQDVAYIEEVLELQYPSSFCRLIRENDSLGNLLYCTARASDLAPSEKGEPK